MTERQIEDQIVVDGMKFIRIHGDKWLSENGQIEVRRPSGRETFIACIDLEVVRGRLDKWKRFRSVEAAMRAGVKTARAAPGERGAKEGK
jgi:hypothetical protein